MWLPTWIGMHGQLIKEIEQHISPIFVGQLLTDEVLDRAGEVVLQYLSEKFPNIKGIFEYLDGLKYVETDAKTQEGPRQEEGRTDSSSSG